MTGEQIFNITMALIDEVLATGQLDAETTSEYRGKAPYILTMLQNEIVGIENRYRKKGDYIYPVAIESLEQTFQIDDIKANALLTNGLAAHLMLSENTDLANFFQQRYEEMKGMYLKPIARNLESKEDVYDSKLSY